MPGWSKGTVGYHVDDGKIFHAENPDKGKEVEGNIWLSLQLIKLARRVMGFEPCIDTFSRVRRSSTPIRNDIMVRKVIKDIKLLF